MYWSTEESACSFLVHSMYDCLYLLCLGCGHKYRCIARYMYTHTCIIKGIRSWLKEGEMGSTIKSHLCMTSTSVVGTDCTDAFLVMCKLSWKWQKYVGFFVCCMIPSCLVSHQSSPYTCKGLSINAELLTLLMAPFTLAHWSSGVHVQEGYCTCSVCLCMSVGMFVTL